MTNSYFYRKILISVLREAANSLDENYRSRDQMIDITHEIKGLIDEQADNLIKVLNKEIKKT